MLKVKKDIAMKIMKRLIASKMSAHQLRNNNSFKRRRENPGYHDTKLVSYLGPKICNLVLNETMGQFSLPEMVA